MFEIADFGKQLYNVPVRILCWFVVSCSSSATYRAKSTFEIHSCVHQTDGYGSTRNGADFETHVEHEGFEYAISYTLLTARAWDANGCFSFHTKEK